MGVGRRPVCVVRLSNASCGRRRQIVSGGARGICSVAAHRGRSNSPSRQKIALAGLESAMDDAPRLREREREPSPQPHPIEARSRVFADSRTCSLPSPCLRRPRASSLAVPGVHGRIPKRETSRRVAPLGRLSNPMPGGPNLAKRRATSTNRFGAALETNFLLGSAKTRPASIKFGLASANCGARACLRRAGAAPGTDVVETGPNWGHSASAQPRLNPALVRLSSAGLGQHQPKSGRAEPKQLNPARSCTNPARTPSSTALGPNPPRFGRAHCPTLCVPIWPQLVNAAACNLGSTVEPIRSLAEIRPSLVEPISRVGQRRTRLGEMRPSGHRFGQRLVPPARSADADLA